MEQEILLSQLQNDGTYLIMYPDSLDYYIAYDNSQTNYKASNINQAFLETLRAPQIQVSYNNN